MFSSSWIYPSSFCKSEKTISVPLLHSSSCSCGSWPLECKFYKSCFWSLCTWPIIIEHCSIFNWMTWMVVKYLLSGTYNKREPVASIFRSDTCIHRRLLHNWWNCDIFHSDPCYVLTRSRCVLTWMIDLSNQRPFRCPHHPSSCNGWDLCMFSCKVAMALTACSVSIAG